ncbi:MAG: FkbM family methyltransferase [Alphaproteobacteria bacterium]
MTAMLARLYDRFLHRAGEPEQALLPYVCPRGEIAVDVGANHGSYTVVLARLVDRVVAVEPIPFEVRILRLRFAGAVAAGRVEVVEAALSDASREVTLMIPSNSAALASVEAAVASRHHGSAIRVSTRTLDSLGLAPVGFIKIDVEGHEGAVLRGGMGTVARDRPTLLIEIEERHHPGGFAEARDLLEPLGYRGWFLMDGRLRPIAEFDHARLQNVAALNAEGTGRRENCTYISNFLFVARTNVHKALRDGGLLLHD